eukprot:CAMPEP_0168733370 /NCGR_PEP_ID=MMETSP0724-20121128/8257_1 /TAXON_ID=265536 /ORGANISM="Amphiprora sp., Strain CCMP467" /LENGTH=380 /DNA_ID=CAMNT_0008780429 /DNA_START=23 /DNA_END=1162 /DNA_ORIENTATION=-
MRLRRRGGVQGEEEENDDDDWDVSTSSRSDDEDDSSFSSESSSSVSSLTFSSSWLRPARTANATESPFFPPTTTRSSSSCWDDPRSVNDDDNDHPSHPRAISRTVRETSAPSSTATSSTAPSLRSRVRFLDDDGPLSNPRSSCDEPLPFISRTVRDTSAPSTATSTAPSSSSGVRFLDDHGPALSNPQAPPTSNPASIPHAARETTSSPPSSNPAAVAARNSNSNGKGSPIQFVSGKYQGKSGWLDKNLGETAKMIYVIVSMNQGNEIFTRVMKGSIQIQDDTEASDDTVPEDTTSGPSIHRMARETTSAPPPTIYRTARETTSVPPSNPGAATHNNSSSSSSNGKGSPIKFVSGKYQGKSGWLDKNLGETAKMIYVIVS